MERYRLRHAPKDGQRKLLLPLSYGISSLVLLHILDQQLNRQLSSGQGRAAYDLHVLVIETSKACPSSQSCINRIDTVRAAYPRHTYSEIPFHSLFRYIREIGNAISGYAGFESAEGPEMAGHVLDFVNASFST